MCGTPFFLRGMAFHWLFPKILEWQVGLSHFSKSGRIHVDLPPAKASTDRLIVFALWPKIFAQGGR
jgi:hypothetical protein